MGDDIARDLLLRPNPESKIQKLFLPMIGLFFGLLLFLCSQIPNMKLKIILSVAIFLFISIPSIFAQLKYNNLV